MTILADILRALTTSEYSRKMFVVYKANLNFKRINRYLRILLNTGMVQAISSEDESALYRITDRGREFLAGFDKLKNSLNSSKN
jgi:predicted transcriptional regulator